jgi:hypothetical protein
MDSLGIYQNEFYKEIVYSIMYKEQKKWKEKVEKELNNLKEYEFLID